MVQADESPGTYFWHDHSAMNRANGLQGVLILGMPVLDYEIPVPLVEDGEHVVFITDWFDMEANTMAMQLNRCGTHQDKPLMAVYEGKKERKRTTIVVRKKAEQSSPAPM